MKRFFLSFAFLLVYLQLAITPAYAQKPVDWVTEGCVSTEGVATLLGITCVVKNLLIPLPAIIAFAAFAMVILAGIRLINAGADPKAYSTALSTFQWAIIGILLLSGAWLILVLIEKFTGAQVTQFGT